MKIKKEINEILNKMNLSIVRRFPRHSIRFAKKYFGNKKIEVIEIGTDKGKNAESILKNLNVDKLFLIDPYEAYSDYNEKGKDKRYISVAEKIAHKRLKKYSNKINFIKKYSNDAVENAPKVDFIYIDGNHKYKYAKKDMEDYWEKLNKKGIMAGHDITNPLHNYSVAKAFVEFCSENKLKPYISRTDWWVIKE